MSSGYLLATVVKKPELRTIGENKVVDLRVAVDEKESFYTDVTFWNKQAETLSQYIEVGRQIIIDYKIKSKKRKFGDKEVDVLELVGTNFSFINDKKGKVNDTES